MKKKAKRLLALLLGLLMLLPFSFVSVAGDTGGSTTSSPSISDVSDILNALSYSEYRAKYESYGDGKETIVIDVTDYTYVTRDGEEQELLYKDNQGEEGNKHSGLEIPSSGTITWTFTLEEAANYVIEIEYCQTGSNTNSIERIFYINGEVPFAEARSIVLTKVWKYDYEYEYEYDANGNIKLDADGNKVMKPTFEREELEGGELGNDIRPNVIQSPKWVTYAISDSNGYYADPFQFFFKKGENTISLESQREPVIIKAITLKPAEKVPTYQEYLDALAAQGYKPTDSKYQPGSNASILILKDSIRGNDL